MATSTLTPQPTSSSERSDGTSKLKIVDIEQSAALRLTTGSLQSTSSRRTYHCRFVRSGRIRASANTLSNIEITPHALQTTWSTGLFNGKAVFIDHAALWEYPSLENLVGVTQSSSWNEADQSIECTIKLYSNAPGTSIANLLDELLSEEAPPDIGLSLVFYPVWEPDSPSPSQGEGRGEDVRRITGITHIESIDLVFQPAADGRILQALSTFHVNQSPLQFSEKTAISKVEDFATGDPPMSEETATLTEETIETSSSDPNLERSEVVGSETVELNTAGVESAAPDQWITALAKNTSESIIAASGLPQASRERLLSQEFTSPDEVTTAIESERLYLAQLSQDSIIQIGDSPPRSPHISGLRSSIDQLSLALDALLAGTRPADVQPLTGLRELYHLLSGDYEMTGLYHPDRVALAQAQWFFH